MAAPLPFPRAQFDDGHYLKDPVAVCAGVRQTQQVTTLLGHLACVVLKQRYEGSVPDELRIVHVLRQRTVECCARLLDLHMWPPTPVEGSVTDVGWVVIGPAGSQAPVRRTSLAPAGLFPLPPHPRHNRSPPPSRPG
jgi:hypothetical protein